MKITVITGSPNKNGTSNYLADRFIEGAKEKGYDIFRFDAAHSDVKCCVSCQACGMGAKPCIFKDDFAVLRENLLESDVIAFVTPVYYFGMTSNIKKVIDRFYSIDTQLRQKSNRAVLISVQHAPAQAVKEPLCAHYRAISEWLEIENAGSVNAIGIESVEQLKTTQYPAQARKLAESL